SSTTDWLALYTAGAPNTPIPANWRYVPLPRPNTQTFTAPTTVGSYQVRLFANDSTTNVIGTCPITVSAGPALPTNDVTVADGHTGTTNAIFTVTLSPTSPTTVTVNFATANGTAAAGSDYTANS